MTRWTFLSFDIASDLETMVGQKMYEDENENQNVNVDHPNVLILLLAGIVVMTLLRYEYSQEIGSLICF